MANRSAVLACLTSIAVAGRATGQTADPKVVAERIMSVSSQVAGERPTWSPDGARVLFLSPQGLLQSVAADGGAPTRVAGPIATQLVRISPKGDQVAYLSDKSGNPELWLWNVAQGDERQLTNFGARINAMSFAPNGESIAFSALRYGQFDLWKVRLSDGRVTRLTTDPLYDIDPSWTPDGQTILYFRADDRWADHHLMAISAEGGSPRVVAADRDMFDYGTIGTRSRVGYPEVSPDGKSVLFRSHRSGWIDYWVVPTAGGMPRQIAREAADQSDARWSPDGKSIAFVSNRNGTHELRVVSATGGESRSVVAPKSGVVANPEWSPDGARIAYTLATPTRPQDLYVVPSQGGAPRALTSSIEASVEQTLIVPEKVSYQSDGFTINAYLYRPALPSGERAPGIMLIHGGPTGQYNDTYLTQAQFLAQMGYAVLAPNIRGSSGYGKPFEDANNPCWTHCDLRDVLAGVAYLKGLSYVNPDRMGITGNSYGGIMTMGAIAHAPGVFHAAAAQSGYANWISFQDYNTELQHTKLLAYEWGPYPDSAAVYRRNSSIFSADKIATPLLLIFATGPAQTWRPGVYPIPASMEMAHALDRLNKVVKVKTYPNDNYYVASRENAKQVLLDLLDWFDLYLRDGVAVGGRTTATGSHQ